MPWKPRYPTSRLEKENAGLRSELVRLRHELQTKPDSGRWPRTGAAPAPRNHRRIARHDRSASQREPEVRSGKRVPHSAARSTTATRRRGSRKLRVRATITFKLHLLITED